MTTELNVGDFATRVNMENDGPWHRLPLLSNHVPYFFAPKDIHPVVKIMSVQADPNDPQKDIMHIQGSHASIGNIDVIGRVTRSELK